MRRGAFAYIGKIAYILFIFDIGEPLSMWRIENVECFADYIILHSAQATTVPSNVQNRATGIA